jgi:hypothetical protein
MGRNQRSWTLAVALAATGIGAALGPGGGAGAAGAPRGARRGPENVPIPAGPVLPPPGRLTPGARIDGIACAPLEQLAYHIHAHLTIFVDGAPRRIPAGVGVGAPRESATTPRGPFITGGSCISWLHTHAADGIIHVESPVHHTYTLGNFLDVWRQPLGSGRVASASGRVTAFLDGRRYAGDPRSIPLTAHAQVQLDVGRPVVPPVKIRFPAGL